jgi:hypothetical protein
VPAPSINALAQILIPLLAVSIPQWPKRSGPYVLTEKRGTRSVALIRPGGSLAVPQNRLLRAQADCRQSRRLVRRLALDLIQFMIHSASLLATRQ